ncbi:GTPase HflX [Bartonella tamiae]|uniref:GTPase HflX n=1 Tax=Bartonella tamiae Th239 TaxID=1094558 RepID=J0QSI5_9HYPH|nr:GTPase HflX [Bartonella tamiae]EJF88831.1 GTP-binding protein HflX [Bartonella tamiae Th239]
MTKEIERADKLISRETAATRAIVIIPLLRERVSEDRRNIRSVQSKIDEAIGLAQAIRLDVVEHHKVTMNTLRPATLLGPGKVEEFSRIIEDKEIDLAIIDRGLTPVQQRNLEKFWNCKVIDRTALILEIFGDRAATKEGVLQVELAHLNYQKGRLVRSWTHLERQRGGGGFLGGPGETQIESDRRQLQDKIVRIKRELDTVVKTRALHRAKRKKTSHPVIALVGYTNAGKSTLFNQLTGANVLAKDMLFATLDPTLRRITLPHGQLVILSDTVGFISNLPTHLIAAFRATLEEVIEADLILHVRDMSDPDHYIHAQDVRDILKSLGVDIDDHNHIFEIWNKTDLLDDISRETLKETARNAANYAFLVSALKGEGLLELEKAIERQISGEMIQHNIRLKAEDFALLDWIYKNVGNIERHNEDDGSIVLKFVITQEIDKRLNNLLETHGYQTKNTDKL